MHGGYDCRNKGQTLCRQCLLILIRQEEQSVVFRAGIKDLDRASEPEERVYNDPLKTFLWSSYHDKSSQSMYVKAKAITSAANNTPSIMLLSKRPTPMIRTIISTNYYYHSYSSSSHSKTVDRSTVLKSPVTNNNNNNK